jgi:hypothetical protein
VRNSRIEIKKFSGHNFELWKIKIEDLLVYQEKWETFCLGTMPIGMSMEEWENLERRERSMIPICLSYSILLNVLGEDSAKKLWDKLGILYQSKFMVNKLFLIKKLYILRMSEGSSVTKHLNAFNTILSLLCCFPNSWDSLVMDIGRNSTTLVIEDVVSSLLSE